MTDVVILCGGLGTRIRHLLPLGMPKCLADINGRPFLSILLDYVRAQGFERIILATGYGSAHINDLYGKECIISYSEPRGTWDAIKRAAEHVKSDPFLVLNGDTFCALDYEHMLEHHGFERGLITVAVNLNWILVGAYAVSQELLEQQLKGPNLEDVFSQAKGVAASFTTVMTFYDIGSPEGLERFRAFDRAKSQFTANRV